MCPIVCNPSEHLLGTVYSSLFAAQFTDLWHCLLVWCTNIAAINGSVTNSWCVNREDKTQRLHPQTVAITGCSCCLMFITLCKLSCVVLRTLFDSRRSLRKGAAHLMLDVNSTREHYTIRMYWILKVYMIVTVYRVS